MLTGEAVSDIIAKNGIFPSLCRQKTNIVGHKSIGRCKNMEKLMNSYETLFIIDAQLSDEEIKALTEKFVARIAKNGTVTEVNEWGKRRLAYPINDKNEGYYVLVNFESEPEFPAELERRFNIADGIMRSIVIRHEDKKAEA